jgi:lipopolysaccharide/colanic/teichoic acid biosynthesis glycosyltransferase
LLRLDLQPHSTVAAARPHRAEPPGPTASERALDIVLATALLILLAPAVLVIAIAIKLDSRGPVIYRCRRAGRNGAEFAMLKFRKMHEGAAGPALAAADDARFTRVGRVLARTKLDELPQLFNVLTGTMSLVGPRPEDPIFVRGRRAAFDEILTVRPGITGLSQLAFAREPEILDADDRERDYQRRILPQKLQLDRLYVHNRSLRKDLEILAWTAASIVFKRAVAVHRSTGRLTLRRRPASAPAAESATSQAA